MANEPDSSSWHPAAMPNSVQDPRVSAADKTPQPLAESLPEPLDQNTEHDLESHDFLHHDDDGQYAAETSFSNDGDAEGGAGLASEEPESHYHQVAEDDPEAPAPVESEHTQAISNRTAPTTAQHSSSMSFARTVSHEVPFNDDDEGEWTLSRTDSDPFKFMPQSDRTNSFPVVPLMAGGAENHHDGYLPSNQALDVLEETERDYDAEEEEYQAEGNHETGSEAGSERPKSSRANHASSRSIGGEVQWSEAAASEARYEEGVPLIPHPSDDPESAAGDDGIAGGFSGSFDDDENDDFFNQNHEAGGDDTHPLQRKSTIQVLAATDSEPLSCQTTLDETPEEDEEQRDAGAAVEVKNTVDHQGDSSNQDIASKWQEAFASDDDDEDFLLEDSTAENKGVDAAAFLGSDDEGLLDDIEETPSTSQPASTNSQSNHSTPSATYGAYAPAQQQTLAYRPAATQVAPVSCSPSQPAAPFNHAPQYGQTPQPQPELPRAQSFADKSKGGYASPYDLPTDLVTTTVKPRKRASMQQLSGEAQPPPPPRSASMTAGPSPSTEFPPPPAQASSQKPSAPPLRNKGSFFEDLPIAAKPRPSSRQSHRAASPSPYSPLGQSPHGPSPLSPPMTTQVLSVPGPAATPSGTVSPAMNLVAPPRVSPYASLQPSHAPMPSPSGSASRYSPAPSQTANSHSAPPPAVASRYSPAPPAARPHNAYNSALPTSASQPILPHLPRTSSPLAHFEISSDKAHGINGDVSHPERRASSSYEPRMNRVPSLPPTREVEEEEDQPPSAGKFSAPYSPPPALPSQSILSPKRPGSSYAPQAPSAQQGFVPPPRAQTQSPGATRGGRHASRSSDSGHRPVSAHSPTSPVLAKSANASHGHPRASSLTMNMIAPTDGREHDPLQRWQGVPIISWGVGGTIVTSFPKSIPRYVMNQTTPSMLRAPGEVKVRNIKDIEPLQDRLAKFPGPLKGKSKKKEVLTWLAAGIEGLEKDLPDVSFHPQLSFEAKRAIERLLLWKLLRVFIEFDGTLEGTPAVDKAVRDILAPGAMTPTADNDAMFSSDPSISIHGATVTSMQADGADSATMEQIRRNLLKGDREAAVWSAVDKRLWGHAMLIAHTVSPDLYKRVAQEFVRKEVNHPGHNNESLAALYKIFSGNYDDCVDELVPVHARAGLQLVSTQSTSGPPKDAMDGLDKWRETLTLVLSNRSPDDIQGLNALGKLLSSYGRAEAAHICFIFSRHLSIFGGMDDPNVDYVLLGSDHRQQYHQVARDTEALQLSEVYEYGLSLSGAPSVAAGAPHLAAYKLHHAVTLAENGFRDKALQYCDAIATAMTSQTRRSPYHHTILETAVDDFMRRLKQAPKEESSSWMSKPSMNKVSDSMWNRFNKFVAGDEQDGNGNGSGDADNGPFARIGTPTISRSPSVSNFETFGVGSPGYATSAPIAASAMSSRYAPVATQSAGIPNSYDSSSPYLPSSLPQAGRSSNEYSRSPYESSYPSANSTTVQNGGYTPSSYGYQPGESSPRKETQPTGYQPYGYQGPNVPSQHDSAGAANGSPTQSYHPEPVSYGYEPPQMAPTIETESSEKGNESGSGGYEPPSFQPYGYEPPSYEPDAEPSTEDSDDAPKPKKKSFMDDDEDDIPALKPQKKSKAEKDRENDEMFRKAAEEDAKRAAAQQQAKKGWGFSSWFGGAKKEPGNVGEPTPGKPIKAKLGEASSFVYDPELKRWVNKKPGAENAEPKTATPPPPRSAPRSVSGTPPPPSATPPPPSGRATVPPPSTIRGLAPPPTLHRAPSQESLGGGAPTMMRSVSGNSATGGPPSRPPSRPTTSMSNASSIDDLLSTSAPRKPGQKKPRKSGRYVDVMAK